MRGPAPTTRARSRRQLQQNKATKLAFHVYLRTGLCIPGRRTFANRLFQLVEVNVMKAFLLACIAAGIVAILAVSILDRVQQPVEQAFATSAVRL